MQVFDLAQYISRNQGSPFNYSKCQKETGLSASTIKKLIGALEAVFILRRLKVEGSFSGEVFYLEDHAESQLLSQESLSSQEVLEQLIYRNLRVQLYYNLGLSFREFYYETRGGVRIPYAIQANNHNLAILPTEAELPNRSERAGAASFLKKYINSRVLFLHSGSTAQVIDEKSLSAPLFWFI